MSNIILNTDSYKYSQYAQYPKGTEFVYSYIESRGGEYDSTLFFGAQAFVKEYLMKPVTMADIDEAEPVVTAHGEPFYREGWKYIVDVYNGYLPVIIKAAPEGLVLPVGSVLLTIENTDPKCYWLTSFLETALLRAVWYPTTVATNSYRCKQLILSHLEDTGDVSSIDFKLHDFGARGVSSLESAGLGGSAHLINFLGTDTVTGLLYARKYYNADMAGFSIPAMEHSTVTSWGRENEVEAYRNMLRTYGKPGALLACVSDSYDIYEACKMWGTELKQEVLDSGATVVIRPDSGDPATVVLKCVQILDEYFGSEQNEKGYYVLNNVRIMQGDGINLESINDILETLAADGYSADNVAFGMGGGLLQHVNRDTFKFAMKCSAARINNEWVDVFKDPITDSGKRSKKGRVTLFQDKNGNYFSDREDAEGREVLQPIYLDGALLRDMTFEEVRANARK